MNYEWNTETLKQIIGSWVEIGVFLSNIFDCKQ